MNPELRRNLWLEFTTHRLVAMPAVLFLAFMALAALDKSKAWEHVNMLCIAGFALLTVLWGSRLATNSIIDEVVDKTWDWQRLSTLGPWTMTWGKLFGSTAFAWYGGMICLVVFLGTSFATTIRSPLIFALSILLLAIMLQAACIAVALHLSRNGAPSRQRSIGILLVFVLIYFVPSVLGRAWGSIEQVPWYGMRFDSLNFMLGSSMLFAAWAVIGAWRAMCQSLAVRTTPWLWLLFLAFVAIYSAGFVTTAQAGAGEDALVSLSLALPAAGIAAGFFSMYMMLFSEPTGPLVLRRVLRQAQQQQWRRAWQEMPCWPVSWLFAALCAVVLAIAGDPATPGVMSALPGWTTAPVPFVLLAARDAGIFLFFAAAPRPKRVAGTTIVYMLLLDWILPGILNALGLSVAAQMVFPFSLGNSWALWASALAQALIAGVLAWRRMQVNFSSWRRADGA